MVCKTCQDTHQMWMSDLERKVPCTACPTPCQVCRFEGKGAYCATTPCSCSCHAPVAPPAGIDLAVIQKHIQAHRADPNAFHLVSLGAYLVEHMDEAVELLAGAIRAQELLASCRELSEQRRVRIHELEVELDRYRKGRQEDRF